MATWKAPAFVILLSAFILMPSLGDAERLEWGKNVGPVFAKIIKTDSPRGLGIRSKPSMTGNVMWFVKKGGTIRGLNEFSNGWMKIRPSRGWAQVAYVKPVPFEAKVTSVDSSKGCLTIRKGPGKDFKDVGCAQKGEVLKFTGIITFDKWLQLRNQKGWVASDHVQIRLPVGSRAKLGKASNDTLGSSSRVGEQPGTSAPPEGIIVGIGTGSPPWGFIRPRPPGNQPSPPPQDEGTPPSPDQGNGEDSPRIDLDDLGPDAPRPPTIEEQVAERGGIELPDTELGVCRGNYCATIDLGEGGTVTFTDASSGEVVELGEECTDCRDIKVAKEALRVSILIGEGIAIPVHDADGTWYVFNPDGTITNWETGEVVWDCSNGSPEGSVPCLEEWINQMWDQYEPQAQTASSREAPETFQGGGQGGTGTLAPPSEIPTSDDGETVAGGTGGTGEDSGWMTIQPVGRGRAADSGGSSGPTESSGSKQGNDSGWYTIQPVGPQGPSFTSGGGDKGGGSTSGKDFGGGGSKSPPVIGGGSQPTGPTPGYTLGQPVSGGSSSSSTSSSSSSSSSGRSSWNPSNQTSSGVSFSESSGSSVSSRMQTGGTSSIGSSGSQSGSSSASISTGSSPGSSGVVIKGSSSGFSGGKRFRRRGRGK